MYITVSDFANASLCFDKKGRKLNVTNRKYNGIIVTKSGEINFSQNGKTIISAPNMPIFIPKGSNYLNECLENAESFVINFNAETDISEIIQLSFGNFSKIQACFDILADISVKAIANELSVGERFLANSKIYELLAELFENRRPKSEQEIIFENAVEIIGNSYCNAEFSCKDISLQLNVSEVYLRRIFIKYAGIPTGKYIAKVRMEQAAILLREKTPIKQTASKIGYSDVYGFSRAYSKYFGFPPSKTQ